jgi:hypothetical protein
MIRLTCFLSSTLAVFSFFISSSVTQEVFAKPTDPDTVYCPGPYLCFRSDSWAYYATISQLYEEFGLQYHVGEFGHIAVGDTLKEIFVNNDKPDVWRTIYDGYSYSDTVRTMNFPINAGDTIQFWHDFDVVYPVGTAPFMDISYSDTLEFVIELVSANDGSVLSHLKTTRIYPVGSYESLLEQIVSRMYNENDGLIGLEGSGQPDSAKQFLLRKIVPASIVSQDAYIRVTPVFLGDYQERGLWRVDRAMGRRSESLTRVVDFIFGIYDSLVQEGDTLAKVHVTNRLRHIPLNGLHVWPNPSSGHIAIQYPSAHDDGESLVLVINASTGAVVSRYANSSNQSRLSMTMDLSGVPKGQYFVVLVRSGSTVSHQLITLI